MIVETTRTIKQIGIQLMEFITSDNEQLLATINAIKKRKHFLLRIAVLLVSKSLFKFIEKNNYFLLD